MIELYPLLFHLRQCPEIFLCNVDGEAENHPQSYILLKDVYRKVYGSFNVEEQLLPPLHSAWRHQFNDKQLITFQIACWFFSHPFFNSKPSLLPSINAFLFEDLVQLSPLVSPRAWIEDEDRAEEFIRLALKRCHIPITGESTAASADRFDALSTTKRIEIITDTNMSIERIKEIRRKMEEEKAREAANSYGRD